MSNHDASRMNILTAIANGQRPCHGCGRQMPESMWHQAPATPGRPWERDCPDCANAPTCDTEYHDGNPAVIVQPNGAWCAECAQEWADRAVRRIEILRAERDQERERRKRARAAEIEAKRQRNRLRDGLKGIAARRCICDGCGLAKRHGGPCCGVAGGKCVTCQARSLLAGSQPARH